MDDAIDKSYCVAKLLFDACPEAIFTKTNKWYLLIDNGGYALLTNVFLKTQIVHARKAECNYYAR